MGSHEDCVDEQDRIVHAAVGATAGTVRITTTMDTVNHVAADTDAHATDHDLHRRMQSHGYAAHAYDGLTRTLSEAGDDVVGRGNVLYLRDPKEAQRRVRAAPTMKVGRFTL